MGCLGNFISLGISLGIAISMGISSASFIEGSGVSASIEEWMVCLEVCGDSTGLVRRHREGC